MARDPHRREDLLRDATALVPRLMLRRADGREIFAGFRGDALSLYFGEDPVYHFTSAGELRRAHVDGRIVKAEQGKLICLMRRESAGATTLFSGELDAAAEQRLLGEARAKIEELRAALDRGEFERVGEQPPDGDCLARLKAWLAAEYTLQPAASPRVG